jgi:hypothetical protein
VKLPNTEQTVVKLRSKRLMKYALGQVNTLAHTI